MTAAWPLALVCGAVALLSSAFLYGTPHDEEEFRFAILAAWLRVRALSHWEYPYWSSQMGFGVPQPFMPNFALHPLLPLLGLLSPVTWIRVVLFLHTMVGAVGMWLICRRLRLAAVVGAVCCVSYVLALPVQNYVLSDFWPSHYVMWTTMPWILLLAWRILRDQPQRAWRAGIGLGLVTGIAIANTNPGHAAVYVVLALAIAVTSVRAIRQQWRALALAALIAVAIVSPNVTHLIGERRFFDQELALSNLPEPVPPRAALDALLWPLRELGTTRTLFVGLPFSALALVGCVWFARARTDLVIATAGAGVMLFTEWVPADAIAARYQFRDPLTLGAILLAGCVADRWLKRQRTRVLAAAALLLQAVTVTTLAWPLIERTWRPEGRRAVAFRGATGDTRLSGGLLGAMSAPQRLLYSPGVERAVSERALVDDGLGVNALAYRNAAVVNGLFKGVSTDTFWPNDRLFYGWIRTPQALLESDPALDVLGIRYVLTYRGEQVAPRLREVWSDTTTRGAELVLFENADAWPGAFLVDPARLEPDLPRYPTCSHDRLLCKDLGRLADMRDSDVTSIERGANEIRVAWPPIAQPRLLIVTEMHRPDWTANAGAESLPVQPVYGGFIGVMLRAGQSSVRLNYRPTGPVAASAACYGTIAIALAALAFTSRRRRVSPQRDDYL